MIPQAASLLDRLRSYAIGKQDLTVIGAWIERNTRHPRYNDSPWTFKDHEFQIGIANCPNRHVVVTKPSQVGVSELSARVALALLDIFPSSTAIYTLPTANFARKFAKTRIDPIVAASPHLKAQVPAGSDSSELKQFGASFLYINGTSGASAPISIPADILVQDEIDFSDQDILSQYMSRLGHAEEGGIYRGFSTPTIEGYGVSKRFAESTQARYTIRCERCGKREMPTFLDHVVIPGYSDAIINFDKSDLTRAEYDIDGASLLCPACRQPYTAANLMDPRYREWVHAYPDREVAGFQVMPFDVYKYNPIKKTLRSIEEYSRRADWFNFKVGVPFQDAETSVLREVADRRTTAEAVRPQEEAGRGYLIGMDVGKVSHLLIGKPVGGRRVVIVHAETIRQTGENALLHRVKQLLKWYGVPRMVVDAMPDFTTAQTLIQALPYGVVFANYYVRSVKRNLSNVTLDEANQVVSSNRTGTLDEMVKRVNSGRIEFAKAEEMTVVKDHLCNIRRISAADGTGQWVKVGPDHYAHALNYLLIAQELCDHDLTEGVVPVLPGVRTVTMGEAQTVERLL